MTEQSGHKAMAEIRRLRLEAEAYTADAPEEDDFWAQERARAAAERGRQADPGACGTCRGLVAAGGQVVHDECAQRATLLQAPDHPHYELITGMTEEEVWALPARFHVPVFLDTCTPKAWVCAVCWGDGWNTQWPCKTARDHGTAVFTPEHQAQTAAKKQAGELAELRQALERLTANRDYWRDRYRTESRTTWSSEVPPGGEVCADCGEPVESEPCAEHNPAALVEQLRAQLAEMTRLRDNALRALHRDDVETDIDLEETIAAPFYGPGWDWDEPDLQRVVREAAAAVRPAYAKMLQRVTELEAERARYVGKEPTIAEEMAYLSRCLDAVYQLCAEAKRSGSLSITPEAVEHAADGEWTADTPRAALPWAHAMDDGDLHDFLNDLVSAAMGRWRSEPEVPDRTVLADIEKVCSDWRTPGQGLRSDEPETEARPT